MRVSISFLYLMPVLAISNIAATNKDSSKDRMTQSFRRNSWKSVNSRRAQLKLWPRVPPSETSSAHSQQPHSSAANKSLKSNIILILTDDQDVELGSLNFMSETGRLIRDGGAEFRHAYTTTPMCCPSRSSILTGLYVHNHNIYTNNDNCSNLQWQIEHETKSFAAYLSNAGYHTGYFGKYLNKYNGSHIPPGWNEWGGLIMNSKYYNYSINLNGKHVRHGYDYSKDYYTDLVANDSMKFLHEWKMWHSNKPALLVMSFPAPHGPEDSAPEYSDMFLNVTTHHTPSYDFAPNPDKQWILRVTGHMTPVHKHFTDMLMTKRLQTLQSVDNAVKRVCEQLKEMNELDNTFIIYTSDHGYHLGQFGLVKGKSFPFEFDVRVPFLIRGPGIEPGSIVNELALNIDLAPTILDIAGLSIPPHMDGRSLLKLFQKRKKGGRKYPINWPDTFLIESSGRREMSFLNANYETSSTVPTSSSGEVMGETAVMEEDATDSGSPRMEHHYSSKAERLSIECQRPEYASPCKRGQKWHCVLKNNRWRKHKCKFSKRTSSPSNLQKCTCVTEDGIVYMRFQTIDNNTDIKSTENPSAVHYLKLNQSSDDLVNELANSWRVMKRQRRNTSNKLDRTRAISNVNIFDGQIIELPNPGNDTDNTVCMVQFDGTVKCSPEIYRNLSLWRASHKSLATQIKWLQGQIRKLKEVQRHLENMQPNTLTRSNSNGIEFRNNASNNALPNAEAGENAILRASVTENLSSHKHRHHHDERLFLTTRTPELDATSGRVTSDDGSSQDNSIPDTCYCAPHLSSELTIKDEMLKEQKRRIKEHRKKKKERKMKKRAKLGDAACYSEKMNCFNHDKDHWRTPPYWTDESFCFCVNAMNNTYNCIRTINATHNFLYCEFVTGLITFYNMRIDPFQQWNRYGSLSVNEKFWLSETLSRMVQCKGHKDCGLPVTSVGPRNSSSSDVTNSQFGRTSPSDDRQRKRKHSRSSGS